MSGCGVRPPDRSTEEPCALTAQGFGPTHPVCPKNDTEDCKAQNRRTALRVTAK
jgi:outer membrane protein OmpA-like peptidoglycan-associated protein